MAKATKSQSVAKAPASTKPATKAKPAPKNPDAITQTAPVTSGGNKTAAVAAGGQKVYIDNARIDAQLTKLLTIGGSFKTVQDYLVKHGKPAPALARGVESRTNPHSSKAVQDQRVSAKPAKAESAPRTKAPVAVAKDMDGKAAIKLTAKGKAKLDAGGNAGSIANLTTLSKSATVAAAVANGLKKTDITYAVKTGTITVG